MKQKTKLSSIFAYFAVFAFIVLFSMPMALALSAVDLGTAGDYVVLAKSGISTTGTTAITGDIGVSPIDSTAITGFGLIADASNTFSTSSLVTGKIYAADYTSPTDVKMTAAIGDMETAYTDAAGRTLPDYTELYAGDITGQTLAPGLYKWSTGVLISAGGVTLSGDANDVWIFQIAEDLTVADGAIITLSNGAQASNIFWQVSGGTGVSLGTTSDFKGNILTIAGIVIKNGATLNGRALAQTAVTLDANAVTLPILESPVLTTITLLPASANLTIGSTQQINAMGFDQYDESIAATINYTSNDTTVATVSSLGLVTAIASGSATITATSGIVTATSIITVETAAPILNSIGSRSVTQGTELYFTLTATSPEDLDLIFGIVGKPTTASFTDNFDGTATFSWTPELGDVGVTNVNFTVTDGIKSDSEIVAITINEFQAPTTTSTNGNIWKNVDYNITLNAIGFNNTPIAYINYSLNNVPGQISGSVGDILVNTNGNNTLTFYAVDTLGNVETINTISAPLDKIVSNITSFTLSATSVNVGDTITGTCTVTDNLDTSITGVMTGIDTTTAGTKTATCTATDLAGNIATADTTYTVNAVTSPSGGSSSGSSGGGGVCVTQWTCTEWDACVNKIQTRTCSYPKNFCTPQSAQPTLTQSCAMSTTALPTTASSTIGGQDNTGKNTGVAGQDDNQIASNDGNLITGMATSETSSTSGWPDVGWWNRFVAWVASLFN